MLLPALLLVLGCNLAFAQETKKKETKTTTNQRVQQGNFESESMGVKDGIIMENGRLMLSKDGQRTQMQQDLTLQNGAKLMRDGTIIMKNGEKMKLENGDIIFMTGEVKKGGMAREGEQPQKNMQEEQKKIEYYYDKKYVESPLFSQQIEQRLELMNQKMFLMSEKMRLMNEKMSKMSSSGSSTSNLDQQIQNLDAELKKIDAQMKK